VFASVVFIVNGEKAADRGAAELAIVTTCAPDGEGKWWGEYTKPLAGKAVRIIVDHDDRARNTARSSPRRLRRMCAK
jgi:hypothetical protein